ncbi:MAG: FMN-binding negative transcriptional regulator [Alphaproteobacteria bacterium]
MYTPKAFAMDSIGACHALMRTCPFAIPVSHDGESLAATHIPFLLEADGPDDRGRLLGHMARANPQWQACAGTGEEVLVVFPGPHAYVSPTWYEEPARNVPTWNYVTVHAQGPLRPLDPDAVRRMLGTLSAGYEGEAGWRMDMLSDQQAEGLSRAIMAFEIPITRLEGKQKLSQNKAPADRRNVARGLREAGEARLAALVGPTIA